MKVPAAFIVACAAAACAAATNQTDFGADRNEIHTEDAGFDQSLNKNANDLAFCGEGYYIRLGTTPTVILIDGSVQYHGASLSSFLHPYLSASPNCVRGSCCPQALHFMTTRMAASARRWSRSPPLSLRSMDACVAPRTRGSFEWRG